MDVALIAGLVGSVVSSVTLVVLIGGGFYWSGRVSARVDSFDQRIDTLDSRIGTLDNRIGALDNRIDTLDRRMDTLDNRIDTLDNRIDTLDRRMDTLDRRMDTLSGAVNSLRVELLDEMRRNQQQLLTALSGHAHSDTNEVWFGQPLGVGTRIVHLTPPPGAEAPAVPPGAEVPAT